MLNQGKHIWDFGYRCLFLILSVLKSLQHVKQPTLGLFPFLIRLSSYSCYFGSSYLRRIVFPCYTNCVPLFTIPSELISVTEMYVVIGQTVFLLPVIWPFLMCQASTHLETFALPAFSLEHSPSRDPHELHLLQISTHKLPSGCQLL